MNEICGMRMPGHAWQVSYTQAGLEKAENFEFGQFLLGYLHRENIIELGAEFGRIPRLCVIIF